MTTVRRVCETAVLLAAGWASIATTDPGGPGRSDSSWILGNLFDGQTAVARDLEIELRIGIQDFRPMDGDGGESETKGARTKTEGALHDLSLTDTEDGNSVELEYEIGESTTIVRPVEPLQPNTRYELDASVLAGSAVTWRPPPGVVEFTTRPGPQVTGVWRVDDTLMIAFSEPLESGALELAADSVDLLWECDAGLCSVVADRNLADFAWDNEDKLFRVAPIPDYQELWVKVSRSVTGESGALLDGDGDGNTGELDDDFLELVTVSDLPICRASEDRPEPCVAGSW